MYTFEELALRGILPSLVGSQLSSLTGDWREDWAIMILLHGHVLAGSRSSSPPGSKEEHPRTYMYLYCPYRAHSSLRF